MNLERNAENEMIRIHMSRIDAVRMCKKMISVKWENGVLEYLKERENENDRTRECKDMAHGRTKWRLLS